MSIKHTTVQDVLCQQNCTLHKTLFSCIIKNWHYVNSGMAFATSMWPPFCVTYLIDKLLSFNIVNQYEFLTTMPRVHVLTTLLSIMHISVL